MVRSIPIRRAPGVAVTPTSVQWAGAILFAIAIAHTFSTKFFERRAHRDTRHAGAWHMLAEVEIVFGFWAMVMVAVIAMMSGTGAATAYLDTRNFTEPMFVFAIMVVAASRAVLQAARNVVESIASFVPVRGAQAFFLLTLAVVPLLGSFITEPAAMTLAALMLRDRLDGANASKPLKYATLGALFVNVSIGGVLTPYAAPPVLMVAAKWQWDVLYMLTHFGWKMALAVFINAAVITFVFRKELANLPASSATGKTATAPVPWIVSLVHLLILGGIVAFVHHPPVFMGLFLLFMGVASAYPQYQDRLILREGLLVAFFLSGLVVLGGLQSWWLEPLLHSMNADTVYFGATALTAITDNAALTYLGSQVEGLSEPFKRALVAGAITGGGLTVIANAPNPAGFAILRGQFEDGAISPLGLFVAALPPTMTAILAFRLL
jgi:hypothetical protein